ncbi:hypothetical protein [Streptomyces sp. TRM68416]|uniref:hypothetical protein n=1 Tax=Streptomyces sp. TRM68416 TaxID=2758412 RepID=UPI001CB713CF|nr:hypothetical protein [Streptomyces sp. TRM68416]
MIAQQPGQVLAREIFGPLGGILEIGAVSATGTWSVAEASVGDLVERHRADVDRLLDLIRETGRFSSESMAIGEQLGWLRDHQVTAPSLLLWSGNIQEISPRIEELEEPRIVRRMCRMGAGPSTDVLPAGSCHRRSGPGAGDRSGRGESR